MKKCEICDDVLQGRKDKRFCSDKCKSASQYDRRITNEGFFFEIGKQLRINRKVLKKYNQTGYTTLRRPVLHEEGFNPNVFTHYWKNKDGEVYLFVYEYGFRRIEKDGKEKYLLIEWQEYMRAQLTN